MYATTSRLGLKLQSATQIRHRGAPLGDLGKHPLNLGEAAFDPGSQLDHRGRCGALGGAGGQHDLDARVRVHIDAHAPRTGGATDGVGDLGDDVPMMNQSKVRLPREVRPPYAVYINGVAQQLGRDYEVRAGALVFERELRKDKISGWRWLLGAWGVGTYRQNDSVDVRYAAADGSPRVAEGLEIEPA